MDISVIIPLFNEEESLIELHQWVKSSLTDAGYSFELIFIDDGSSDNSWNVITNLSSSNQNVFGYRFSKNYGKAA